MDFKITGTLIKNYFHCPRQAWLYSRGINFASEITRLGNALHEEKETEELIIGSIKIDGIDRKRKEIIEYKKSSSNLEGSRMQVLYYLWILEQKGMRYTGRIVDMSSQSEYTVKLDEENRQILMEFLQEIQGFLNGEIPKPVKIPGCRKCSFYDYCWS